MSTTMQRSVKLVIPPVVKWHLQENSMYMECLAVMHGWFTTLLVLSELWVSLNTGLDSPLECGTGTWDWIIKLDCGTGIVYWLLNQC